MSNPFDDLESDTQADETTGDETDSDPEPEPEEPSGPAFPYDAVRQRPLYARDETWDEFEDALGIDIVPELRRRGIRDEENREIHDAVLRLASENPERIVELIEEERTDESSNRNSSSSRSR